MTSWRIVFKSIREQPGYWLLHFLSITVFMLLIQAQALVIGAFFDLLAGQVMIGIGLLIAALFGVRLLRNGMQLLFIRATPPFAERVAARIREAVLVHIFRQPGARSHDYSVGDVVSRFRSDAFTIPDYVLWLNESIALTCFSAVAVVSMWHINPLITTVALIPLVVVVFIARASAQRIEQYRHASQVQSAQVAGFVSEIFGAVQSVKVAGREEAVVQQFETLNRRRRDVTLKDRVFNEIIFSLSNNSTSLSTGLILLLSAPLLQNGTFTVSAFAVFVYYLDQLAWFIGRLGILLARHRQLGVAIQRLSSITAIEPEQLLTTPRQHRTIITSDNNEVPSLETLRLADVTYTYPGTADGIQSISFAVQRGTLTVITGEVGSGKTTLLRVLLGLLPMDSGTIYWNNQPVQHPQSFFGPPRSAYTPQIPHLFSTTLRDNIILNAPADEAELKKAICQAALTSDVAHLEDGLATVIGPRGVRLSGGQRQRTAAARMFVRAPDLLVVDDVSSALDLQTERNLWRAIRESGMACLAVSHRSIALQEADQVIHLKAGRMV